MLQTTVYLVSFITLGAVTCLFRVAIKWVNKYIKILGIIFYISNFEALIEQTDLC